MNLFAIVSAESVARRVLEHMKEMSVYEERTLDCGVYSLWFRRDNDVDFTLIGNNISSEEGQPILDALKALKNDTD